MASIFKTIWLSLGIVNFTIDFIKFKKNDYFMGNEIRKLDNFMEIEITNLDKSLLKNN